MPINLSSLRNPLMNKRMQMQQMQEQQMGQQGPPQPPMAPPPPGPMGGGFQMDPSMPQMSMGGPPQGPPPMGGMGQGQPNPMLEQLQRKMMANRMQGAMGQPPMGKGWATSRDKCRKCPRRWVRRWAEVQWVKDLPDKCPVAWVHKWG